MNRYQIRPTTVHDVDAVMAMYDHSRALMRAEGNSTQWVGYPTREQLQADMRGRSSFLVLDGHRPVGTFALVAGAEPTYGRIDHGRWLDPSSPYATLHRMAKVDGAHGVAAAMFDFAKRRHRHLRIDTHESNRTMRHLVAAAGFVHCGTVYMADGSERLAYEWWRWDEVGADLREWVESEVLPRYEAFDAAHRTDHARRVVARAMLLLPSAATYVAAAMHDLGLAEGREEHHRASGRIVRQCRELRQWFSESDVELIAQAAEDHRASATGEPRSLLGRVVAEADRDVEPERIVRRTVEYGLTHYPTLDREGHWQRTLEHLHEKYAEGGYIRLWLDGTAASGGLTSPNAAPLAELRALIADRDRLRTLFDTLFDALRPTALNLKL